MDNETAFRPSDEMQEVVGAVKEAIEAMEIGVFTAPDPRVCCASIGISPATWDSWLESYGDTFTAWFVRQLQPSKIERGVIDAMFWKSLRRVVTGPSPNAAHLKLAAELGGHLKERPEPPPIPYLTPEEAMATLRKLGPEVLEEALDGAREDEEKRRATGKMGEE